MMRDSFGREITYARLSATDRCNQRCLYCMPDGRAKRARGETLSLESLSLVSEALAELGATKQRVTGGEPLTRKGILELLGMLGRNPNISSLGLTTNGQALSGMARAIRDAGVDGVNISLDTLDPAMYATLTGGGRLSDTLDGLRAALSVGLAVKLNAVLVKGANDSELRELSRFAADSGVPIRFIELMPFSDRRDYASRHFLSVDEAVARYGLKFVGADGKVRNYAFPDGTPIGFIGAITRKFCADCDRIRVTSDGKLMNCLHESKEYDLAPYLSDKAALKDFIVECVKKKPAGHCLEKGILQSRCMERIGG